MANRRDNQGRCFNMAGNQLVRDVTVGPIVSLYIGARRVARCGSVPTQQELADKHKGLGQQDSGRRGKRMHSCSISAILTSTLLAIIEGVCWKKLLY